MSLMVVLYTLLTPTSLDESMKSMITSFMCTFTMRILRNFLRN